MVGDVTGDGLDDIAGAPPGVVLFHPQRCFRDSLPRQWKALEVELSAFVAIAPHVTSAI